MAEMGGPLRTLNEHQQRRLLVTCQHIDGMLSDLEAVLNQSVAKSAFPKYIPDIPPAQHSTINDYIARLRAQLKRVLEGQGIPLPHPFISASHAARVSLQFVDVSVEELKPRYMRGYGEVPPQAAIELNGIVGELQGLVSKLDRYLLQDVGQDLEARLRKLEATSDEFKLLHRIQEIVARHGLVEFRPAISAILDRAEDKTFEIAIFGRVSSGKSSLLNAILEAEVLPVGVTPITAVPTRIIHGEQPLVRVWFPEKSEERFELSRLGEFVAEQHNPGNRKHVSRIVVEFPSPQLREGIAFVDTPGLGSLATSGAAETLAYLPRCDLGVVLVDAASTLVAEDLRTIQALYGAAIPATVLLSKADLLRPEDLLRVIEYVKSHLSSELHTDVPIHAVSVRPGHADLLRRWFEEEIAPLHAEREELKEKSIRRKVGGLRQSVESVLRSRLRRSNALSDRQAATYREVEDGLRRATGQFADARKTAQALADDIPNLSQRAILAAAARLRESNLLAQAGDVVRTETTDFLQKRAGALLKLLENAAYDLARELERAAQVLEIADRPSYQEFQALLREMPAFELDELHAEVERPRLASLLGRQFVERALAGRIEEQAGAGLSRTLQRYSDLLKDWTNLVTGRIYRQFESYADTYRAQLGRALGEAGPDGAENQDAIRRDLEELNSSEAFPAVLAVSQPDVGEELS